MQLPHSRYRHASWIAASLLFVGCSGSVGGVAPQPSVSPAPPSGAARGTLGVAMIGHDPQESRIRIFPPHSDQFSRERVTGGLKFQPNSLAFDRRGHLYVGYNDSSAGGRYEVDDIDAKSWTLTRTIKFPQWPNSSVATDDHDNLYVNTKAFIGGDIEIFRNNAETKPYIRIKDHHSPLTMLVGRDALWVGYEGAFANALARYRLRSTDRTWFQTIGRNIPVALSVNTDGSLVAAMVRLKSGRAVDVIDVAVGETRAHPRVGQLNRDDDRPVGACLRRASLGRRRDVGQSIRLQLPRLHQLFRDEVLSSDSARREPARRHALRREQRQDER